MAKAKTDCEWAHDLAKDLDVSPEIGRAILDCVMAVTEDYCKKKEEQKEQTNG